MTRMITAAVVAVIIDAKGAIALTLTHTPPPARVAAVNRKERGAVDTRKTCHCGGRTR